MVLISKWLKYWIFVNGLTGFFKDALGNKFPGKGLTYAPWLVGSDKTVASVGTGNTTFYPLYGTSGLLHNNVRRSDPDALVLIALLPIPKGMLYACII
jgi:hypothetical protein